MKKCRVKDIKLDSDEIVEFKNVNSLGISSSQIEFCPPFEIKVKKGDEIFVGQTLMENRDGQKIISTISGKVTNISVVEESDGVVSHYLFCENDKKYVEKIPKKCEIKSKKSLLETIKNYGILGEKTYLLKHFENLSNVLEIDAFDDSLIYNNKYVLNNNLNQLKKSIDFIIKLLKIEKIIVYCNRKFDEKFVKLLGNNNFKLIHKKPSKNLITLYDFIKIIDAKNGKICLPNLISFTGGACRKSYVLTTHLGVKIQDIINFCEGFKEDVDVVEAFKYAALNAFNDEVILKQKIKNTKNKTDKESLIKLLKEKKQEAYENVFSKREEFRKKLLNCLAVCLLNGIHSNKYVKNLDLLLQNEIYSVHLLNYEQFR